MLEQSADLWYFFPGKPICALATIHAAATQCCHNWWCVIGSVLKRVNCVFSSFSNWFDSIRGLTHEPKSKRRLLLDSVMRINDSSWALFLHNLISIRGQPNSLSPFLTLTHSRDFAKWLINHCLGQANRPPCVAYVADPPTKLSIVLLAQKVLPQKWVQKPNAKSFFSGLKKNEKIIANCLYIVRLFRVSVSSSLSFVLCFLQLNR